MIIQVEIRPIEEAPKDGSPFFGWLPDSGEAPDDSDGQWTVMWWDSRPGFNCWADDCFMYCEPGHVPTHWFAYPADPNELQPTKEVGA